MLQTNVALCIGRAGKVVGTEKPWNVSFITSGIVDLNLFYRGGALLFPLYSYPDGRKRDLFSKIEAELRKPNFTSQFNNLIQSKYDTSLSPEQITHYIYAILFSLSYRSKYSEFLMNDFPRIPFVSNVRIFKKLANLGEQLAELHLLKAKILELPDVKFFGSGNSMIESVKYAPKESRIYINANNYFEKIHKDIWDYQIGGYQVLEKWLKDRKGQIMKLDEVNTYCKIAYALKKTVKIQKAIDLIYAQHKDEL